MSLDVQNETVARNDMANRECILCGTCADGCPANAIHYDSLPLVSCVAG